MTHSHLGTCKGMNVHRGDISGSLRLAVDAIRTESSVGGSA